MRLLGLLLIYFLSSAAAHAAVSQATAVTADTVEQLKLTLKAHLEIDPQAGAVHVQSVQQIVKLSNAVSGTPLSLSARRALGEIANTFFQRGDLQIVRLLLGHVPDAGVLEVRNEGQLATFVLFGEEGLFKQEVSNVPQGLLASLASVEVNTRQRFLSRILPLEQLKPVWRTLLIAQTDPTLTELQSDVLALAAPNALASLEDSLLVPFFLHFKNATSQQQRRAMSRLKLLPLDQKREAAALVSLFACQNETECALHLEYLAFLKSKNFPFKKLFKLSHDESFLIHFEDIQLAVTDQTMKGFLAITLQ